MRALILASCLLALAGHSLAGYSQQYQSQDGHGSYAYGYADPNSQKTEHRSHDGTTHGEYSYVDGDGKLQAVKYVADHAGFHVAGTNLPQAPQQHGGYHTGAALVHSGGHGLYHGPHAAIGHDGHPIETPEVQAAKHAHFKAHAEAAAAAHYGPHQYQAYAPHYAGAGFGGHYQHAVALSAHGTPVETPEVQAAKHAHLQAHAEAAAQHSYGGHGAWRRKRDLYGAGHGGYGGALGFQSHVVHTGGYGGGHGGYYHGPQAVIGPHGQPLETPEVVAAKHAHFAAHAEVKANLHAASAGHAYGGGGFGGAYHGGYLAAGAGGHYGGYHGGAVIGPHGTPLETPEVVAAKHAHFAAHAEAKARNYQAAIADAHSGGHDGGYYAYGGHGHGGW